MKMYRIREFAKIIGFKPRTVWLWVTKGRINAIKIGSEWRIYESELDKILGTEK